MRAVVGYARGRWVAHPLTARRALQEGFACADAVLPGCPAAGAGGAPDGTARAWLDVERLERTALLLGCDPALGIVAGHLSRLARGRDAARVTWLEAGSAASLEAAAGGTAHLAGLHLRDGETGEFNVPQARRALAATGGVVVAFARWAQGFVVAPGNPKAVRTAADLAREDVRLINREPGAGSRSLLDQMLAGGRRPAGGRAGLRAPGGQPLPGGRHRRRRRGRHGDRPGGGGGGLRAGLRAPGGGAVRRGHPGRPPRPPGGGPASSRRCRPGPCGRSCAPSPATTSTSWAPSGRRCRPPPERGRRRRTTRPTRTPDAGRATGRTTGRTTAMRSRERCE